MLGLMGLWLAWCVGHSLLITDGVRGWVEQQGGWLAGGYRIGYVCFSLGSLMPLLWYTALQPQQPLSPLPGWVKGLQGLLLLHALAMFIGGMRAYDLRSFLGVRQWHDYRAGQNPPSVPLQMSGILRHIRHPWYSGGLALLWALPGLTDVTLVTRAVLSLYLIVGTLLEERKLRRQFGAAYQSYCRTTPMLIPWKIALSRFRSQ